jgi:heme/copper-type cytochrome/quinol oxidase subunit 3
MVASALTPVEQIPSRQQPHSLFAATGFVVAGGAMLVASLVGIYLGFRNTISDPGNNWVPRGVNIPNAQLVMAVVTAILSSITAQWVVYAARRRQRGHTFAAIGVTIMFGVAWINMVFFAFNFMEVSIGSTQWANLAYTLSGMAVAIGMVAIAFLALMAIRAFGGEEGPMGSAPLAAAVIFWHYSVLAFILLWYVVFVVK